MSASGTNALLGMLIMSLAVSVYLLTTAVAAFRTISPACRAAIMGPVIAFAPASITYLSLGVLNESLGRNRPPPTTKTGIAVAGPS